MPNTNQQLAINWVTVDSFNSSYWSGDDLKLYANNIYLDEGIQVSYQIVEQVHPYYGYASYTPDRMHHGTRIISGEFSINFVREGYLWSLLQTIQQGSTNPSPPTVPPRPTPSVSTPTAVSLALIGSLGYSALAALAKNQQALALASSTSTPQQSTGGIRPQISRNSPIFSTRQTGFDLNIIYGGSLPGAKTLKYQATGGYLLQSIQDYESGGSPNYPTGIKLIGVELGTCAKAHDDSGRPVIETYSFLAYDIQPIGSNTLESN